jgi:hypothetical protein
MLVLDHTQLDASDAKGRGGGGAASLLSGLLGMSTEEMIGAAVAGTVER